MTSGHVDPASTAVVRRLRFDSFVLDLDRGCLLHNDREVLLRPKTFAVLRHLVENAGRLISKGELFSAVWPDLTVTDDVLVQSVGELRRALGSEGAHLIRTIPRRGYRFDATPATENPTFPGAMPPQAAPVSPGLSTTARAASLLATVGARGPAWPLGALALLGLLGLAAVLWLERGPKATGPGHSQGFAARAAAKPAIAILPFLNQDDDPAHGYLADGLTQDVINALGRFPALTVMSWNAVLPYKGKPAPPGDVGRALAVRYQVEGRLQQFGERVRVIAQLVGADGRVLWSGRFDEDRTAVFALQDKITTQIAGALATKVTQIEQHRILAKPTESFEAYDHVLRARSAQQRHSRAGNVEARALLKRAVELDPNYAPALAALADTYYIDVSMGWSQSPAVSLGRAEELAIKALNLDDAEVRARIILGRTHILYHRYGLAKTEIDRALAINPSDALGLAGRGNILMWLGQTDAAIEALELAQRIDPELSAIDRFSLSVAYYLKHRYDAAIEQAELSLRSTADAHFSRVVLAAAYAQRNQFEDAARVAASLRRLDPTFNPQEFGTKFLNASDLEHLREGLRKARL